MKVSSALLQQKVLQDLSSQQLSYPQMWAAESLKTSLLKKYLVNDRTTDEQNKFALSKFFEAQKRCARGPQGPRNSVDARIDRLLRAKFSTLLGGYCLTDNFQQDYNFGPGASIGSRYNDLYSKLDGPLTGSSSFLYLLYMTSLSPKHLIAQRASSAGGVFSKTRWSRLSFVPKNAETSRTICTEPLLNMMAQKAIEAFLTRVLKHDFDIDLPKQQEENRRYARYGSRTGGISTIDLESASDSISTRFVSSYMPESFARALFRTRTAFTLLPDGRKVRLNMISSMGNAFTFPLQTIIFACIVQACYAALGLRYRTYGCKRYCVNGDDIIVDSRAYSLVTYTLERLGFKVNLAKSFSAGPFRESCGGDYVYGYDVRGVYIKKLGNLADIYSAYNRLRRWSLRHGILLRSALAYLRALPSNPHYVPIGSDVTSGFWATRGETLAWSRREHRKYQHGLLSYQAYTFRSRNLAHDPASPDLMLRCIASGRISSGSLDKKHGYPCRISRRQRDGRFFTKTIVTSIWPSWSDALSFRL